MYFSLFESSRFHATPGKMAMKIMAVDSYYQPLRFGRAAGRYWGKMLSNIFGIGFMIAGWTPRKQGLHDMIASTLVMNKREWLRQRQFQEVDEEQMK
ncbi:RDD family protein [Paenibacillus wulumuqiensis]|uniref:RDD family protein n=1 Tax=Paenibacillus wulumuqiensis TaxID=1567107 RepID=UPI001F258596|nr:RDD family protein [Paenibacillus wulumuqiensis]